MARMDARARPTLALAQALIERRSLTPDDAGCQDLLAERLRPLGFGCETLALTSSTKSLPACVALA